MKGFQPFRRMYVGLKLELSLKESNLPQACFEKDFQNMLGSEVGAGSGGCGGSSSGLAGSEVPRDGGKEGIRRLGGLGFRFRFIDPCSSEGFRF